MRQVLTVTKSNASHSHGVADPSNMFVLEAYVGKGQHLGGIRMAARGRFGRMSKCVLPTPGVGWPASRF